MRHRFLTLFLTLGLLAVFAARAGAAPPDRHGFVFSVGGMAKLAFPTATTVTADTVIVGRYHVTFPGQAATGGVAHVTAVNASPHWCQVVTIAPGSFGETVDVQCYAPGGARDWSDFTAQFTSASGPAAPGHSAYVQGSASGAILSSYNSTGGAVGVTFMPPNKYLVRLSGIVTAGPNTGGIQVTAISDSPARCTVSAWTSLPTDQLITVQCTDGVGIPKQVAWSLSYQHQRALDTGVPARFGYVWWQPPLGGAGSNFNTSSPGVPANTVTPPNPATVTFPNIAAPLDNMQVTAFTPNDEYCMLNRPWSHAGTTTIQRSVACFNSTAQPVNSGFFATYNTQP